jgi:hypothetical protein
MVVATMSTQWRQVDQEREGREGVVFRLVLAHSGEATMIPLALRMATLLDCKKNTLILKI